MYDKSLFLIEPVTRPKFKLFCFPYAGSSASIFWKWSKYLSPEIEVVRVQLPGRGSRIGEELFTSLDSLIEYIGNEMKPLLSDNQPFGFFGHSMGALIAYELAHYLKHYNLEPSYLFLSGRQAPHISNNQSKRHNLSNEQLLQVVTKLNGMPEEVLNNDELIEMILPILRADFEICDTYKFSENEPQNCPFLIFGGSEDTLTNQKEQEEWYIHTNKECKLIMFQGNHFFIHKFEEEILRILKNEIEKVLQQ